MEKCRKELVVCKNIFALCYKAAVKPVLKKGPGGVGEASGCCGFGYQEAADEGMLGDRLVTQGCEVRQKTGADPAGTGKVQASKEVHNHRGDNVRHSEKTHWKHKRESQGNSKRVTAIYRMGDCTISPIPRREGDIDTEGQTH